MGRESCIRILLETFSRPSPRNDQRIQFGIEAVIVELPDFQFARHPDSTADRLMMPGGLKECILRQVRLNFRQNEGSQGVETGGRCNRWFRRNFGRH